MKLTNKELKQIIKEEVQKELAEGTSMGLAPEEFNRWATVVKSGIQKVTGQIDKKLLNHYFMQVINNPAFSAKFLDKEGNVRTPYKLAPLQTASMKIASRLQPVK